VNQVRDVLATLARRCAFADIAALIADGAGSAWPDLRQAARIHQLCAFGQRLLDLDAEDFGRPDPAVDANTDTSLAGRVDDVGIPADLLARALACRMPQASDEPDRGALGSLRPPLALLLEVLAVRWQRRETAAVVAVAHLAGEYLPLLAWERVLGHAGDPLRLPPQVSGDDTVWGDPDERDCPHSGAEKAAARRVLHVAAENARGWRDYLDRQHSHVSRALATCAGRCNRPCGLITRYPLDELAPLRRAAKLAIAFGDCDLVRLRHHSPVGHGFGVPSPREVQTAWDRSRAWLAKQEPALLVDDGYPLAGLPHLVSAVAGHPVQPDTLLADTTRAVLAALAS
jgi:hypothetical protein